MPSLSVGPDIIEWSLRVSPRARRLRITVRPSGVEVVMPVGWPLHGPGGVHAFVQRKGDWIRRAVRDVAARPVVVAPPPAACVDGATVWLADRPHRLALTTAPGRAIDVAHDAAAGRITVALAERADAAAHEAAVRAALTAWLGHTALEHARRWADDYGTRLGRRAAEVRLTNARRRWGSCSAAGVVRVHWRLAQAPPAAFAYVVAHEIAHLEVRDHSARFWTTVERIMPGHAASRAALKAWERTIAAEGRLP